MTDFAMTIAGTQVDSKARVPVLNPATNEECGSAPSCTRSELDLAVDSAVRACDAWQADEAARRSALARAADVLVRNSDELARLLTTEQGKPLPDARNEIAYGAARFRYFAELPFHYETVDDPAAGMTAEISHDPVGVVAVITPWNYPISIGVNRIAPALLCGDTVVMKPSPYTPLTTLRMGSLLAGVFPPGVLNIVTGTDELGQWMTENPRVRAVSFTGSVDTGKRVSVTAGADLKRTVLEMGGNDPAIVLPDADPATVADGLAKSAFANCGQVCYSVKRVYAARECYDELVEALGDRAARLSVGDGMQPGVDIGPLNNRPQFERVCGLTAAALRSGAKAVAGGAPIAGTGNFFPPSVLDSCDDGMALVDKEQFGPVLPVIRYDSLDQVISHANSGMFGLGASVWGTDLDEVRSVGARVRSGTVWLNTHAVVLHGQPHGGARWSANGIVGGSWLGLLGLTELKVVVGPTKSQPRVGR